MATQVGLDHDAVIEEAAVLVDESGVEALTLARSRHQRAVTIFTDEGGPGLLGVDARSA